MGIWSLYQPFQRPLKSIPTSHTTKTAIIILIETMYGFTRHHRVGLGTGCRVTTIRGKFTIGTMTTIGTMAITMIDDAYVDRR